MSSFSMGIILLILVVIVVLLISVVSIFNKDESLESPKKERVSFINENIPLPTTYKLYLPSKIDKIGKSQLYEIVKNVYHSFQYFDYQNMSIPELEKKEWHSWQISMLLKLFKDDEEFFIINQEDVFHPFLTNASENTVKSLMGDVLKKYNNYVSIYKSKDELCKDYIWTNKDASIIFYFLANYKKYTK